MQRNSIGIAVTCCLLCVLAACGSEKGAGGGSNGGNPPPLPVVPDFSLQFESPQVTLQQQGAFQFQAVQVNPVNGFTGQVSFSLSDVPAGVAAPPSPNRPRALA